MKMRNLLMVLPLLVGAGVAVDSQPAAAAVKPRVVWVNVQKGATKHWPIHKALQFVDKYTGTQFKYGKCRANAKCITIKEDWKLAPGYAGMANFTGPYVQLRNGQTDWSVVIQLQPRQRYTAWMMRYDTVIHELGHAMGIYSHNVDESRTMYYMVRWNAPSFSPAEKKILKQH
jgi:hypothetical protein